jgi:hypothetical protein
MAFTKLSISGPRQTSTLLTPHCTPSVLSTGISNLLQPAQAEVVLGQLSMFLASWDMTLAVQYGSLLYALVTLYEDNITTVFKRHSILLERLRKRIGKEWWIYCIRKSDEMN